MTGTVPASALKPLCSFCDKDATSRCGFCLRLVCLDHEGRGHACEEDD